MLTQPNKELLASLIDGEVLYHNAPCGYLSFLPNGNIIKVNRTLLLWLGYQEQEIVGHHIHILFSKGGQIHFEMFFQPLIAVNQEVKELSYTILKKDGTPLSTLLSASVLKNNVGETLAINVVITDISYRKSYEDELLRAKKKI